MRHAIPLGALLVLLVLASRPAVRADEQGGSRDELSGANRGAALLLRERMKRDRPRDYEAFCRIRQSDLLVVRGVYDQVDRVLGELGVPFTGVDPGELARLDTRGYRALVVNCPGRIGEGGVRAVREFVERGGFLFSMDWAVENVLESAFPHTVRYTRRPTRDDVVSIRVLHPEDLLLRHLLTGTDRHLWWLERESYPFEVLDPRRVNVMIDSEEMREKYGAGTVAASFTAGRGRVVHIVSHFYLQRSELRTDRDRLPAEAFAGDLGFPPGSPEVGKLAEEGLSKVPAGELRTAYSAQQFLANLLVAAMGSERPEPVPPEPRPVPPVTTGSAAKVDATLRDAPEGRAVKAIPAGLPLAVLEVRGDWVRVVTRAGSEGWLRAAEVAR